MDLAWMREHGAKTTLDPAASSMDLSKWSVFSILDPKFVETFKMVCVFGSAGNEALIVTKDDDVFALGSNCSSCLGIGDSIGVLEPRRVEVLCGQNIIGFSYGTGPHVLTVTRAGILFVFGHNGFSQLGNGSSNPLVVPTAITMNPAATAVIDIACGSHHSLALTADGECYAWGQNNCGQIGCNSTTNQPTPRKITSCIGGRRAVAIACGQTSSMVVLENGELFSFGYNGNGQLGVGNNTNQSSPCRVINLQGVVIMQVVCGYAHTMALSDEGVLYAWGANSYGQLGIGNKTNLVAPQKIAADIGRIVEIAASHYCHISVALTQTSKVYMWGQCRGQSITLPMETSFQSMHDVFACFAAPPVTWKPIQLDMTMNASVVESLRLAFDDTETSDMKFMVEAKPINVHKAILKIRCEHFRSMFQDHWEEASKDTVEISQFPYAVYRAFLLYLYTGEVDLPPQNAVGLLDLANAYCEPQLKRICERIIKRGITVENAAVLYASAVKYEAKELEEFCFRFSINHLTAVAQTEAFKDLDEATMKNFILKAALKGAFKY